MDQNLEYVAFDLETTGLVAETDRVVEIGAVRFAAEGQERDRFESLVHPERLMAKAAEAVHGISDAILASARPARVVLPEFLQFLRDPETTVLLAHNAAFDASFLGKELGRCRLASPGHVVIDTLALARRKLPALRDHRLDTLARLFRLDPEGPHRALADSRRVQGLWLALEGPSEPLERLVSFPVVEEPPDSLVPNGWEDLVDALAQGWTVRMVYEGGSRGDQPRDVTPRSFVHRGGVVYLVAHCHLDSYEKSFRLDRVRSYEVIAVETPCA